MCWQICLFMNLTCKRYCMEYRAMSVCTVIAHNHYWSDTVQLVVILIYILPFLVSKTHILSLILPFFKLIRQKNREK